MAVAGKCHRCAELTVVRATTPDEIPLSGGRITRGVVRVGATVRRPSKPSSAFVACLLAHLEEKGCAWAPRYIGTDDAGRDVLSYLSGTTRPKWARFEHRQLCAAAIILRELHDITRGSQLAGGAVVCHNDPGPHNFVFRDDIPVAIIDFDMAAPGDPLEDIGYMAWAWCISSNPKRGPVDIQIKQVRMLADAYGMDSADREKLPDAILERQARNVTFWAERLRNPGDTETDPEKALEIMGWSERELRYTEDHRVDFLSALLC